MKKRYKNQPSRENRINLTLSDEEKEMVMKLKNKHSINISNFIRESIKKMYEKMEE